MVRIERTASTAWHAAAIAMGLGAFVPCLSAVAQSAEPRSASCQVLSSEVTLGALSGRVIDSVSVVTTSPDLPSRVTKLVAWMHSRTRPDVIRQSLLFARGDTVDTLRIAESMRRLRQLPYVSRASLTARVCPLASPTGRGPVELLVETRDAWTTRPDVKVGGRTARVGLTERDVLGTGRTVALDVVSNEGSLGIAASAADALGFGPGVATRAQYQQFTNGSVRSLSVARPRLSVSDRWLAAASVFDSRREPRTLAGDDFERTAFNALVGRRVSSLAAERAVHILAGIEWQRSRLDAAAAAQLIGPALVERRFIAPDVGIAVAATRFDTLTWLLPSHGIVDVPRSFEGEAIIGVGRGSGFTHDRVFAGIIPSLRADDHMGGVVTHVDAWMGREWLPSSTSRVLADLWANGYQNATEWHAASFRTALTLQHAAHAGVWEVRGAAERLADPDPDVRSLSMFDRILPFVPARSRLSEAAFAFSVNRSRHLRRVSSGYTLDASVFGATSRRWDPATPVGRGDDLAATVAGVGLSLVPSRQNGTTIRLDFGIPVSASPGVPRSPRFAITLAPWLEATRHRIGTDQR